MTEGRAAEVANIDIEGWRAAIRRDALANHHYSMACAIARTGNTAAAIERLKLALQVDRSMTAAYADLAVLLRAEGHEAEALAAEQQAAGLSADWKAEAALRRGRELAATNHPAEALAELAVAEGCPALRTEARAEIANIHFAEALRHHATGDLEATFAAMRVALSYDDENPTLLHHISHQFAAAGDIDRAAACAAKAARLTTDAHRGEYLALAVSFLQPREQLASLCSLAADVIAREPTLVQAHILLAQSLIVAGRPEEAQRAVRTGLAVAPDEIPLWVTSAFIRYDTRQDAAAFLDRLLTRYPEVPLLCALRASLFCEAGQPAEAVAVIERGGEKESGNLLRIVALALGQAGCGNIETAQHLLRGAAAAIDTFPWWHRRVLDRVRIRHDDALAPLLHAAGLPPSWPAS